MLLLGTTYVLHAGKAAGQKYGFVNLYNKEHPSLLYQTYFNALIIRDFLPDTNVTFTAKNVEIKKGNYNYIYVRSINGKGDTIKLYRNNKLTGAVYFGIDKKMPLPELKLGHNNSKLCFRRRWIPVDTVYCNAPFSDEWNRTVRFNVVSFKFSIEKSGAPIFSEMRSGCTFTNSMRNEMLKATTANKFVITNAVVKDEQNNEYLIPRQVFSVE